MNKKKLLRDRHAESVCVRSETSSDAEIFLQLFKATGPCQIEVGQVFRGRRKSFPLTSSIVREMSAECHGDR